MHPTGQLNSDFVNEILLTMDINTCIAELLYEHNSVSLPGIGSITCRYRPVAIDHVQGKIAPPAKELTLDANLVLDDGLLAEATARRFGISIDEASSQVAIFMQNLQNTLDQREMFTIPGVGRLYRDFEQKLQFLPEEVNYNPESYGLPTLHYYPAVRRAPATPSPPTPSAKTQAQARQTSWIQRHLVWLAPSILLLLALTIYLLKFAAPANPPFQDAAEIPNAFHNVKPGQTVPEPPPSEEEDIADDSEAPTLPPGQKICTIRIGRFGNTDNVKRLVRKAQELGMNPYTEKTGNLTEVGITFSYTEEKEIREILSAVRKSLSKDAVVEKQ